MPKNDNSAGATITILPEIGPATVGTVTPVTVVSDRERAVLKIILDRDRTSRVVHGGLKSLLQLTDEDAKTLLGFLDRI